MCGNLGLSPHQKITLALWMLCYRLCADATDKYCRISETTATRSMKQFCLVIRDEFEAYRMGQPTCANFEKQLAINVAHDFLGMFAILDCMHYEWNNCPMAWHGDFGDRDGK